MASSTWPGLNFAITGSISSGFCSSSGTPYSLTLPSTFLTCLTIWRGIMLCLVLYSSCFFLLLSVSSIVLCMEPVIVSAYIITLPSTLRAALPAVCVRDLSLRRKPSLSASSMATNDTCGRSSPSLNKLTPISTSNLPSWKSSNISTLSRVSTSEWM
ncbi:hypothetical protein SDC9_69368 [bioreactor metagenome]|uniref:Uncharacterized protein n=1 Tax=bioreactor metagenome TaxID=1076179 RepID=A0A644Y4Q1_9ZZZZ